MTLSLYLSDLADGTAATVILVLVTTSVSIAALIHSRRETWPWPKVPGSLPFVGNFHQVGRIENLANQMTEWANEYGKERGAFHVNLAGVNYLVACREDMAMEIMNQRPYKIIRNDNLTAAARGVGADGVFSAEGETWKSDRRMIAPVLNKQHVEMYLDSIKTVASRLVGKWISLAEDGSSAVIVNGDLYSSTIDMQALFTFGKDFDSLRRKDSVHANDVASLLQGTMFRGLMSIHYWKIPFIGQYLDCLGWCRRRVIDYIESVIAEYEECEDDGHSPQKATIMGKLLTLVKGESSRLDRQRMVGNLLTVFFAGTDATGSILSSMLWMIATDKSGLQDELAKEARDLGDINVAAFQEINSKLPKLKSAAYETQRIYSAFPIIFLKAAQQVVFDNTTLPGGTQFLVMTRYVSTNPISPPTGVPFGPKGELPSEFCARRWLMDGGVQPPCTKKGAFMAFGHGPRTCPGRDLAEIVTLVVISSVLQRFEISLAPGHATVQRKLSFAEVPDQDIHLILKPRNDI